MFYRNALVAILILSISPSLYAQEDVDDIIRNKTNQTLDDIKKGAKANMEEELAYQSRSKEEVVFEGTFIPAGKNTKLAIWSDDGVSIFLDGVKVWSKKGDKQHLPNIFNNDNGWGLSFHDLGNLGGKLIENKVHKLRIEYANTIYTGDYDIDGCTLFAYADATVKPTIDIDIYHGQNGSQVKDPDELSRGATTVANLNDTDGDTKTDKDEKVNGTDDGKANGKKGRNEHDLMRIDISKPIPDNGGDLTLKFNKKVFRVWEEKTRETFVKQTNLSIKIPTKDLPITYWIEATDYSRASQDLKITADYQDSTDEVSATAVWAKLTKAFLDPADKTIPDNLDDDELLKLMELFRSKNGAYYGLGTQFVKNGKDTQIGGGILTEFQVYPQDLKDDSLGVVFNMTRQRYNRAWLMRTNKGPEADHKIALEPLKSVERNWPSADDKDNEAPNDEHPTQEGVKDDSDNDPKVTGFLYLYDRPFTPLILTLNQKRYHYLIRRDTFRDWVRVKLEGKKFKIKNYLAEGSRASKKIDWHMSKYLKQKDDNFTFDFENNASSFTPPFVFGAKDCKITVKLLKKPISEPYRIDFSTVKVDGKDTYVWELVGLTGSVKASQPEQKDGTTWVLKLDERVEVTIVRGKTDLNLAAILFGVLQAKTKDKAKLSRIGLGSLDPTDGP